MIPIIFGSLDFRLMAFPLQNVSGVSMNIPSLSNSKIYHLNVWKRISISPDITMTPYTPFYFCNNIFYTEYLGWNLRSSKYILRINPRLRVWKGPILCKHSTIYVFNLNRGELFLSLNSKNTSHWNPRYILKRKCHKL